MPTTPYKGLSVQTAGSNPGVWGAGDPAALNEGMIELVDRNLGGIVTKSLAAGDVTLSATEAQNVIVRLTGILPTNRVLTSACQGFYFVENLTTGSFTVTVTNGVTGTTVPQGQRTPVIADATNGVRLAAPQDDFVSGDKMLFFQTTPPTGWTKDTSLDNGTIRMVSGSVGADAGSLDFTDVFTSRTPTGTVGNTTLTTNQIPSHDHFCFNSDQGSVAVSASNYPTQNNNPLASGDTRYTMAGSGTVPTLGKTSPTGGGASHTHTWTGDAMGFGVKYANAIRATKD